MQRFRVDLKEFLGLAMPNQYFHAVTKLMLGWFVGGIFGQETPNLNIVLSYYIGLVNPLITYTEASRAI